MNCRFFREQIVLENYNELEGKLSKALERHLQICPKCKRFQARLIDTQQTLDQWTEINRPPNIQTLHRAIQSKLFSLRAQLPSLQWAHRGILLFSILSLGFTVLPWLGVNVKWEDHS